MDIYSFWHRQTYSWAYFSASSTIQPNFNAFSIEIDATQTHSPTLFSISFFSWFIFLAIMIRIRNLNMNKVSNWMQKRQFYWLLLLLFLTLLLLMLFYMGIPNYKHRIKNYEDKIAEPENCLGCVAQHKVELSRTKADLQCWDLYQSRGIYAMRSGYQREREMRKRRKKNKIILKKKRNSKFKEIWSLLNSIKMHWFSSFNANFNIKPKHTHILQAE